jgi:predicted GTPase
MTAHRKRVLILGAAGRDFHNFNVAYRTDPGVEVVAFTAAQIPGIAGRRYPSALAGPLYPQGIPILDEARLEEICRAERVDEVVFAYSDVTHEQVMHLASRALACGADFSMLGPERTMLRANRPVIAISAVRTGCGKSQIARWLSRRLRERGLRAAALRHPMPYGDLVAERVQRFATRGDLDAARCTAEEREEYEPHIAAGNVVFAGVDYAAILAAAEREAQVIVWDGGNNDFPFLKPDVHIVVVDALRPDHVATHHPGEAVARMADIVVINKVDSASAQQVDTAIANVQRINARAVIVRAASPVTLDADIAGKRVLVVEDGPTLTHGGMAYGAGYVAARRAGAVIVDPRPYLAPELRELLARYPHVGPVLPAVGYDEAQRAALRATIEASAADVVVAATPIDLAALLRPTRPVVRARYEFADAGEPTLEQVLEPHLASIVRQCALS